MRLATSIFVTVWAVLCMVSAMFTQPTDEKAMRQRPWLILVTAANLLGVWMLGMGR